MVPTQHDGEWGQWTKSPSGEFTNLSSGEFGKKTGLDIFNDFWQGKLSPVAGVFRDKLAGQNYSGEVPNVGNVTTGLVTPLPLQNFQKLMKDPDSNAASILGSMILDGLGFGVKVSPQNNVKSQMIPEDTNVSHKDLIKSVQIYADAVGTDPETAFKRMFAGEEIVRVDNGTVIVKRMSLKDSTAVKKKGKANNPTMKLDHTLPLELGGSNDESNLRLVTTAEWASYTKTENALGRALKAKKISKNEAQQLIADFKNKKITDKQVLEKIK